MAKEGKLRLNDEQVRVLLNKFTAVARQSGGQQEFFVKLNDIKRILERTRKKLAPKD